MDQAANHHEFGARTMATESSSNRSFGLLFAVVFAVLAIHNWWHVGRLWPLYAVLAALFLVLALAWPASLALLNRLWTRLGLMMGMIVSPIVLALLFLTVVTPVGLLMRLMGKDPMRVRKQPEGGSYWIVRDPPGPSGESMRDQF